MRTSFAAPALVVALLVATSGCFGFGPREAVGSAAKQFLDGTTHPKLIVEIDAQSGKELRGASVDLLRQRLGERLDKPGGITYDQASVALSQETWTLQELRDAEKAHRDHHGAIGQAAMYILVVGGAYEKDGVLGVAYTDSSVALFRDTIDGAAGLGGIPLFSAADVEKAVLIHEAGHLLGLVNIGIKMVTPHEMTDDPVSSTPQNEGRGHSNNKNSVMYWAVESDVISQVFNGPPPTQFDDSDIADMRAAGGK